MELPELKYSYYAGPRAAVIIADWTLILPKEMAKEIVLRCNSHPDFKTACEYTKTLLSKGIGQNTHALSLLESALTKAKGGE